MIHPLRHSIAESQGRSQDRLSASPRRSRSACCRDRTTTEEEEDAPLFTRHTRPVIIGFGPPKTEFGTNVSYGASGQRALPLAAHTVDSGSCSAASPGHHSGQNEHAAKSVHLASEYPQDAALERPGESYRPSAPLPFANPWDCPGHFSPSESVSDPDRFIRESSMQQWRRLNRDCAASVPPAASLSFQPVDTLRRSNSAPPCRPPAPHQAPTLHANDTYGVSSNACALSLDHNVSQVHGTPRGQLYNFHSTEVKQLLQGFQLASDASAGSMSPSSLTTGMHAQHAPFGRGSGPSRPGRAHPQHIMPPSGPSTTDHSTAAAHACTTKQPPEQQAQRMQLRLQAPGAGSQCVDVGGAGRDIGAMMPVDTSEVSLYQQRVEALENVVQIQEQQLLGISSLGKAERPDVAAMLPKWRHETLRQFELRLRAQLSAKNAEAAFNSARGELEDQVQRAEASRAAAEDSVHELQQQLLACEKRAQHAAAAEAAALLRAQAAEARAAGAESKLKEAAETSRKCMSGMHAVEGSFETVNSKLDEFSTRMDFAVERVVFATQLHSTRHTRAGSDDCYKPPVRCTASPCMKVMNRKHPDPMANNSRPESSCSHSSAPVDTLVCSSQAATTASSVSSGAAGDMQATAQHSVAQHVMQKEMGALREDRDKLLRSVHRLKASLAQQVEEKVAAAVSAEQATAATNTQHALATQQQAQETHAAEIDSKVRSIISTAAAEATAKTEKLQAAVETRLGHFEALCQRTHAAIPLLIEKLSQYSKEVPELRGMLDQASAESVRLQSKCEDLQSSLDDSERAAAHTRQAAAVAAAAAAADAAETRREAAQAAAAAAADAAAARRAEEVAMREGAEKVAAALAREADALSAAAHAEKTLQEAEEEAESARGEMVAAHKQQAESLQAQLEDKEGALQRTRRERNALLAALRETDKIARRGSPAEAFGMFSEASTGTSPRLNKSIHGAPNPVGSATHAQHAHSTDSAAKCTDPGAAAAQHTAHKTNREHALNPGEEGSRRLTDPGQETSRRFQHEHHPQGGFMHARHQSHSGRDGKEEEAVCAPQVWQRCGRGHHGNNSGGSNGNNIGDASADVAHGWGRLQGGHFEGQGGGGRVPVYQDAGSAGHCSVERWKKSYASMRASAALSDAAAGGVGAPESLQSPPQHNSRVRRDESAWGNRSFQKLPSAARTLRASTPSSAGELPQREVAMVFQGKESLHSQQPESSSESYSDTAASGGVQRAPLGRQFQHAADLFNAKGRRHSRGRRTTAPSRHIHAREVDSDSDSDSIGNADKGERMHAMHDTYDPMHPPKVPAEARHGRSVPQKLLDPSARRSADVRSMHELEHQRRARSTSNVEQPHARVRERDMHEEHDCVHVVHASQDAGSDSDDSYAWAHQKAEMQRKGVWRGHGKTDTYAPSARHPTTLSPPGAGLHTEHCHARNMHGSHASEEEDQEEEDEDSDSEEERHLRRAALSVGVPLDLVSSRFSAPTRNTTATPQIHPSTLVGQRRRSLPPLSAAAAQPGACSSATHSSKHSMEQFSVNAAACASSHTVAADEPASAGAPATTKACSSAAAGDFEGDGDGDGRTHLGSYQAPSSHVSSGMRNPASTQPSQYAHAAMGAAQHKHAGAHDNSNSSQSHSFPHPPQEDAAAGTHGTTASPQHTSAYALGVQITEHPQQHSALTTQHLGHKRPEHSASVAQRNAAPAQYAEFTTAAAADTSRCVSTMEWQHATRCVGAEDAPGSRVPPQEPLGPPHLAPGGSSYSHPRPTAPLHTQHAQRALHNQRHDMYVGTTHAAHAQYIMPPHPEASGPLPLAAMPGVAPAAGAPVATAAATGTQHHAMLSVRHSRDLLHYSLRGLVPSAVHAVHAFGADPRSRDSSAAGVGDPCTLATQRMEASNLMVPQQDMDYMPVLVPRTTIPQSARRSYSTANQLGAPEGVRGEGPEQLAPGSVSHAYVSQISHQNGSVPAPPPKVPMHIHCRPAAQPPTHMHPMHYDAAPLTATDRADSSLQRTPLTTVQPFSIMHELGASSTQPVPPPAPVKRPPVESTHASHAFSSSRAVQSARASNQPQVVEGESAPAFAAAEAEASSSRTFLPTQTQGGPENPPNPPPPLTSAFFPQQILASLHPQQAQQAQHAADCSAAADDFVTRVCPPIRVPLPALGTSISAASSVSAFDAHAASKTTPFAPQPGAHNHEQMHGYEGAGTRHNCHPTPPPPGPPVAPLCDGGSSFPTQQRRYIDQPLNAAASGYQGHDDAASSAPVELLRSGTSSRILLGDSALAGFPLMDSQQVNAEIQESIVLPPQHRHVMHAPQAPQCFGPAPLPQGAAPQNASAPAESHTRDSGAPGSPAAAAPGAFPLMNSQQVCDMRVDDGAAPLDTGVHALHSGAAAAVDAQQLPAGPRLDSLSHQRLFQRQGSAAAMLGRHASGRGVSGILATVTGGSATLQECPEEASPASEAASEAASAAAPHPTASARSPAADIPQHPQHPQQAGSGTTGDAPATASDTGTAQHVLHSSPTSDGPHSDSVPPRALRCGARGAEKLFNLDLDVDVVVDGDTAEGAPIKTPPPPSTEPSQNHTLPVDATSSSASSAGQHDGGQMQLDEDVANSGYVRSLHNFNKHVEAATSGDALSHSEHPELQQHAQVTAVGCGEQQQPDRSAVSELRAVIQEWLPVASRSASQSATHSAGGGSSAQVCPDPTVGPIAGALEPPQATQSPDSKPPRGSPQAGTAHACDGPHATSHRSLCAGNRAEHTLGASMNFVDHQRSRSSFQTDNHGVVSGHLGTDTADAGSGISGHARSSYCRDKEVDQKVLGASEHEHDESAWLTGRHSTIDSDNSAFVEFACEAEGRLPHAGAPHTQSAGAGPAIEAQAAVLSEQLADLDSALSQVMLQLRSSQQDALLASPAARAAAARSASESASVEALDADEHAGAEKTTGSCVVDSSPGACAEPRVLDVSCAAALEHTSPGGHDAYDAVERQDVSLQRLSGVGAPEGSQAALTSALGPEQEEPMPQERVENETQQQCQADTRDATPDGARSLLGAARKLAATFRGKTAASNNPRRWFGVSAGPQCREASVQDVAGSTAAYGAAAPTSSQFDGAVQNGQENNASLWQTQFSGMSCRRKRVSK